MIVKCTLKEYGDIKNNYRYILVFDLSDYTNTTVPCIAYSDKEDIRSKKGVVSTLTSDEKTNIDKYKVEYDT